MIIWEILGVILVALIIIGIVSIKKSAQKAANRCTQLFMEIDAKYGKLIEKSITLALLQDNNSDFNMQSFIDDSIIVIKPEIEGLIANINSIDISSASIEYNSTYFKNAISITESLFTKSYNANNKKISKSDEDELYEAFKDAIKSDLTRRKLDLKIGNI